MVSAFIFDLDGTLFDSAEANVVAYGRAFDEVGVPFNEEVYRQMFGLRYGEMMNQLAPGLSEEKLEKIRSLKVVYYEESLSLVRPNHGLISLLKSIQGAFKTALVTTASEKNVENLLKHFEIDHNLFNLIITGEQVTHGKPDPECYKTAISQLGIDPDNCYVFEDSEIGVKAATLAGANVIRVAMT